MYKTKIECIKYLKDRYKNKLNTLIIEKNRGCEFSEDSLLIIKNEYDIFYNTMLNNIINKEPDNKVIEDIKRYKIFLDFIYSHGDSILFAYKDLYINNKNYNYILTKIDKNLPTYMVRYIEKYFNR